MSSLLRQLHRPHLAAAVLPLLFLAAALSQGISARFEARESAYTPLPYPTEAAAKAVLGLWKARGLDPAGRRAVLWSGDAGDGGSAFAAEVGNLLRRAGVQLAPPGADLASASAGAEVLVLAHPEPPTDEALRQARAVMEGRLLADLVGAVEPGVFQRTGLVLHPLYFNRVPPWADLEFRRFLRRLERRVPAGEALLLFPSGGLDTVHPRSRWYLHLNYALAPRPLYLPYPEDACGTAERYQDWVARLDRRGDDAELLRRGLEATGARWVIRFRHDDQFRLRNWRILSAEEALAG